MKNILFYGDSNVWGSIASWQPMNVPSKRYDQDTRWTGAAANLLGDAYYCVEEGLCGRTSIYLNPEEVYKNGERYLLPCILSHRPLDLVVLMLGTNDLRLRYSPTVEHLGDGIARLVDIVQACPTAGAGFQPAKVLIVSPIHVRKPEGRFDFYNDRGDEAGEILSHSFAMVYAKVAEEKNCAFLDAAVYASADLADGLHIAKEYHGTLGSAVASKIREILE